MPRVPVTKFAVYGHNLQLNDAVDVIPVFIALLLVKNRIGKLINKNALKGVPNPSVPNPRKPTNPRSPQTTRK